MESENEKKNSRVTARDVARAAGVSVATVSYVMNDRPDQKIKPETKKKILQMANLMNYVPSHAAKSLATGRNNTIGISYCITGIPTYDAKIMLFSSMMTERLNRLKYDVMFIPVPIRENVLIINRNIDAIIAIDLKHDDFKALSDSYLVPVICVDMCVDDELFYQIYDDIPFLIEKAKMELGKSDKYYFLYDNINNAGYEQFVLKLPPDIFPLRLCDLTLDVINSLKNQKIIALGGFLTLTVMQSINPSDICGIITDREQSLLPPCIKTVLDNGEKKANLTINILLNSLKRNFTVEHNLKVR